MAEEEYEDVFDKKKIGALALGVILAAITITYFLGYIQIDVPNPVADFTIPEKTIFDTPTEPEPTQQPIQEPTNQEPPPPTPISPAEVPVIEDPENHIKQEYKQYLEFGISADDIYNIQELPCDVFIENQEQLSDDPKFQSILDQRRAEC